MAAHFPSFGADLVAAVAPGNRTRSPRGPRFSSSLPGSPTTLNRRPAAGLMCPLRPQWHPDARPVSLTGYQQSGVYGTLEHAELGRIPGLRVQAKKFAVLISDIQCCRVMPSAAE